MKILTFTSLYPNHIQTVHGLFVEQRLKHLGNSTDIEAKVVAPVPWFPFKGKCWGLYGKLAQVNAQESRNHIDIYHPKYIQLPKVGMTLAPFFMAIASYPLIRKLQKEGYDFDLFDAHYFYPDGVAAVILGKLLNKPVVITARGSDVNLLPQYALPRKMIQWAAKHSIAIITVCEALKNKLVKLGVQHEKIHPLRNGVDLKLFKPQSHREKPNVTTLLSVGHLLESKGQHLIIDALRQLPDCQLVLVGEGIELHKLEQRAKRLRVQERVFFRGVLQPSQLPAEYSASDIMILASRSEGWPNVLLESMACGTPVIATNVGGCAEVITQIEAGILMQEGSAEAIAEAVKHLQSNMPNQKDTRKYAERFSWAATSNAIQKLFQTIIHEK